MDAISRTSPEEDLMRTNSGSTPREPPAKRPRTSASTLENDDHIALEAMSALEREKLFPALRVKLSVEHGWLTLSGDAAHRVERSAAECVVRYVRGVKGVTNRLVVPMAERR
jgi:osmotically-inducible protein OsmY